MTCVRIVPNSGAFAISRVVAGVGNAYPSGRTGGWREEAADDEKKLQTAELQRVNDLRCTSPAPKPSGFGLRLRAKRKKRGADARTRLARTGG